MSDFEDVFGAGSDSVEVIEHLSSFNKGQKKHFVRAAPRYLTRTQKKYSELKDTTRRLGFKWCLKHHVIDYPPYSMKAVFLDRVDDNRVSRLIIDIRYDQDRSQEVVVCLLITKEFKVEVSYPIDDWNSFDNAMLIAVDFKFSKESPFVNLDTFNENSVYAAL